MNVLFVSQCHKRALTETRRILDQFAERRGERTWQTPITQSGLDTVRKLLRQNARKNTAVACHWIHGRDHSELLWVVGDARQFNAEGAAPTNTTANNVLRAEDESNWHRLPLLTALSALAALLHDLGKATQAFQERLKTPGPQQRNLYRHEWVSLRLFQAFVGSDDDAAWLRRLAVCAHKDADEQAFAALWLDHGRLLRDGIDGRALQAGNNPFACLPPCAQALAWLVLTHHRLPCLPVRNSAGDAAMDDSEQSFPYRRFGARPNDVPALQWEQLLAQIDSNWNEPDAGAERSKIQSYWDFPQGLPVATAAWRKQAARYAEKLLPLCAQAADGPPLHDPFTSHVARLCLMLADHHYSGIEDEARRKPWLNAGYPLYANTVRGSSAQRLQDQRSEVVFNQTLDEHLLGVQAHACLVARSLPTLARSLPALRKHKGLNKRNTDPQFQWQDKAADLAAGKRSRAAQQGAFIVNMASTGCGKTLGNARIMNALADPARGLRCAFAIGLRTLTLQTGRVFQHDLGLDDEQLAIQVGGTASQALFEYWQAQAEADGSASRQALLDEGAQVLFEGDDRHPLLQRLSDDARLRALLAAPLLVCTVDQLTPATESLRGGRQIAPMLRLMTGDLVLDEPDDFDLADLPALTRLVHWAGLLGARVLLSSATLAAALVEGLYLAYRAGRAVFQRERGASPAEPVSVCCLWIDEFHQTALDGPDGPGFRAGHNGHVQKRVTRLAGAEVRRLARIAPLPPQWPDMDKAGRRSDFARCVLDHAWRLHQRPHNHGIDPASGKRISLGLVRMANIDPLFDVALAIYQQGAPAPNVHVHLCVYHAQFPLLLRSGIEQQLDSLLNRRPTDAGADPVFGRPGLRALIDFNPQPDQLFIVLGSPVTEVGRDHDYDWAVVEPSSMRSLIQLAGRVRRHRSGAVGGENMLVLGGNLRTYEHPGKAAYCKPGFELDRPKGAAPTRSGPADRHDSAWQFTLRDHALSALLPEWGSGPVPIDARPRIAAKGKLEPTRHLLDLELARIQDTMLVRTKPGNFFTPALRNASLHWHEADAAAPRCLWLTGLLPQFQRFRHDSVARVDVVFLPDEEEQGLCLHRVADGKTWRDRLYVPVEHLLHRVALAPAAAGVTPWLRVDLLGALKALAHSQGLTLQACAERYAGASLPYNMQGWRYHELLGFTKSL